MSLGSDARRRVVRRAALWAACVALVSACDRTAEPDSRPPPGEPTTHAAMSARRASATRASTPTAAASLSPPRGSATAVEGDTVRRFATARRVVAIGDLHGDLGAAQSALRLAGATDAEGHWKGGKLVVVQTGDLLDRGDDDLALLEYFERCRREAIAAGGALIALLGNHEVMNAQGDFRYVTAHGMESFARFASRPIPPQAERFPEPIRGRAAAFMPGGYWAERLARQPVVVVVAGVAFVHGGLLSQHVRWGLGRINSAASAWLRGERASLPAVLKAADAPYWTRRWGSDPLSPADCSELGSVLASIPARALVVGHTVQKGGITSACDGRLWRIDAGLAAYYGHAPSQVLEIAAGEIRVLKATQTAPSPL